MRTQSSGNGAGTTRPAGSRPLTQTQKERLLFKAWLQRRCNAGTLTTESPDVTFSRKRGKEYVP